jgi:GR25 family glycosyltransferase involved in LPS biosynthesis
MNYKILVVNLKRRIDRKDNIIKLFENINFERYTFFEAIDGTNTNLNYEIKKLFENNDFNNKKGVIGCALSFYNIWINLSEDKYNNYYILFEDDIYLSNNFTEYFIKSKEYINNNIDNTDILFLGYTPYNKNILNNTDNFNIVDFNSDLYIGGFFGYIITKNGANKMLDFIDKNGIKYGIDYLIKINKDLKLKVINPLITFSKPVESYCDDVDTDIQKNNDFFNLNEIFDYNNYLFIKDQDQIDNDYINDTYIKNNINDLINISNKDDDIVAFNTLGFFKTKIDSLSNSKWYGNNDGIFIKLNSIQKVKIIGDNLLNENFLWNNIKIVSENYNLSNNIINYHIINKNRNILNLENSIFIEDENNLWNNNYYNNYNKNIIKNNDNLLIINNESLNNDFLTYIKNKSTINFDLFNENINNRYKYSLFSNNLSESIISETLAFYNKKLNCIDPLAYIYIDVTKRNIYGTENIT